MLIQPGLGGPSSSLRLVYAIFEGGGAKGITHIGALKALEREGLAVAGVAGSSAGAIIAALVAVGYSADELFSEDGSRHILSDRKKTPIDLLGKIAWNRFRLLRLVAGVVGVPVLMLLLGAHWAPGGFLVLALAALGVFISLIRKGREPGSALVVIAALLALAGLWWAALTYLLPSQMWVFSLAAVGVAGVTLTFLAWPLFSRWGLFTSRSMRILVNELLREKLALHYKANGFDPEKVPRNIRFRHIDPATVPQCVPLKIIVSDVRSGGAIVFDPFHEDYRDAVIADAVAASAAIPFVFESPTIEGAPSDSSPIFVDGGLVSNLPAWTFRKEKRALERKVGGPPIPIIAFTLGEKGREQSGRPTLGQFVTAVMNTGIFGSQKIVQEFVGDLVVIELSSPLKTLDFACTREQATAAYLAGLNRAQQTLARQRVIASLTLGALKHVLDAVSPRIADKRKKSRSRMPRLRLNVVDPVDHLRTSFRVSAGVGMDDDADDRLELDARNGVAPLAFRDGKPLYFSLKGRKASQLVMTKYEHALIARDVNSVICVPVTSRPGGPAERVLCLDSSDSLKGDFNDTKFMDELKEISQIVLRTKIEAAANTMPETQKQES